MNIKSIPTSPALTVKETSDEQRQMTDRTPARKRRKAPAKQDAEAMTEDELTPDAEDEIVRASQPMDSLTVVQLLEVKAQIPEKTAKFPTPKPLPQPSEAAKKLNKVA